MVTLNPMSKTTNFFQLFGKVSKRLDKGATLGNQVKRLHTMKLKKILIYGKCRIKCPEFRGASSPN